MEIFLAIVFLCGLIFPVLWVVSWRKARKLKKELKERYEDVPTRAQLESQKRILDFEQKELLEAQRRLAPLEAEEEVLIAVSSIVFEFDDSDKYKDALLKIKESQKKVVKEKRHIEGPTLTFEGDKKFHTKIVKLVLLAYNAAADDARHSVRWNNFDRVTARFDKQRDTINSLTPLQITRSFHELKVKEIIYTFHREELRQKEKQERKEMQEQMKEEARVEREVEQARKQAERDAQIASKAVAEVEARLRSATEEERSGFEAQLELLKQQLEDAMAANTKALSMAQQTKRGHVYVISNIGSFGEHIYKVGMTRRLVPEDRVKDLGDASVPFPFDIHAMIETEDAPALESELHRLLNGMRVNKVNHRKEFFNITLSDLKVFVQESLPDAEFIDLAEAREYRETLGYSQAACHLERA